MMTRAIVCGFVACLAMQSSALAWGLAGHRLINGVAVLTLPTSVPSFVRSASDTITALGPELDRTKDAGEPHDADRDPGHYVDLLDDGTVKGLALSALPLSREAYDTLLRSNGSNQYRIGFLPYSIMDGWQQVVKDFAIWRVDQIGAARAASSTDRAWFSSDERLREMLTIRDIGVWGHYVGDGSQPLHVSVHYNGWGDYPNPKGYSQSRSLHARFEGEFVTQYAVRAKVASGVPKYHACGCPIEEHITTYLKQTLSMVPSLYELERTHAFDNGSPAAVSFMEARLSAGAQMLRDLIVDAWTTSEDATVGYPEINVRDFENGSVAPIPSMVGGS
jgi:hypothetical protein